MEWMDLPFRYELIGVAVAAVLGGIGGWMWGVLKGIDKITELLKEIRNNTCSSS